MIMFNIAETVYGNIFDSESHMRVVGGGSRAVMYNLDFCVSSSDSEIILLKTLLRLLLRTLVFKIFAPALALRSLFEKISSGSCS